MSRVMEEMCEKASVEAAHDNSVKIALGMLKDGMDIETVAKYTELSLEEVKELAQKKSA